MTEFHIMWDEREEWKARALKAEAGRLQASEAAHLLQDRLNKAEAEVERAVRDLGLLSVALFKAEEALREIATLQVKPGLEKPFRSVANEMTDIARAALEEK